MFLFNHATKKELRKILAELANFRGRHTELVTVYVPAGYNINEMKNLIAGEIGTASNIKSKTTRKNVLTALEKVGLRLKTYDVTPPNGLVMFAGNISEVEGRPDVKVWEFEPPEKVSVRMYRCDQAFVLDPLLDLVREKEIYGLVTIDASEATVAFLRGKSMQVAKHVTSLVPGKTGKGGQSSARYGRVREGLLLSFEKEIGELATKIFETEKDLQGIIVGGPGPIKDEFAAGPFLSEALKKKILGIKDLGYSGTEGLKELIDRSEDLLKASSVMHEKGVLNSFFEHLKKESGLVTYGVVEVMKALSAGAVQTIILSDAFDYKHYILSCDKCGFKQEKILKPDRVPASCPNCENPLKVEEKDVLLHIEAEAKKTGALIEEVSAETPEGVQFAELGGIGAVLRYKYGG